MAIFKICRKKKQKVKKILIIMMEEKMKTISHLLNVKNVGTFLAKMKEKCVLYVKEKTK